MKISEIQPNQVLNFNLSKEENQEPTFVVILNNHKQVKGQLNNAFKIHHINELVKSLKLMPESYVEYKNTKYYVWILECVCDLFLIRKTMQRITNNNYDQIGISAWDIYQDVLDYLNCDSIQFIKESHLDNVIQDVINSKIIEI